jgi:hypothetical protein
MASLRVSRASGGGFRSEAPTERSMTVSPRALASRFSASNVRNRPPPAGVRWLRNGRDAILPCLHCEAIAATHAKRPALNPLRSLELPASPSCTDLPLSQPERIT